MRYVAAVTFENPATAAPATVRVEVDASGPVAAVARAVRAAKRELPGRRWSSLLVLLERPPVPSA